MIVENFFHGGRACNEDVWRRDALRHATQIALAAVGSVVVTEAKSPFVQPLASGGTPTPKVLTVRLGYELRIEVGIHRFCAALGAVSGILDAPKRGLG